ncbi:MAG: hypothetical protein DI556_21210 [Rhodovulum sulfidophilum]|uniref:Transglycosylase SLT domain-containing protein n=1 Tax=Rhodovulum sulfidophilum TaxID=35806 RepID=A0A2W5N0Y3_RHOSU|nr:MAG: hypothetical protein DI556_21210 [Rhodovulum sulfidophilum]
MIRQSEFGRKNLLALAILVLHQAGPARSEVWEFDRAGRTLAPPASPTPVPENKPYDVLHAKRVIPAPAETGRAAVYRPMAEGVARAFAAAPGVTGAGLDADAFSRLFVALIDQESRFDPDAVSPKGARGLGQLMPATAAALGVADAFEPLANLRGAARYLTAQLAAFGRVDLALAAYNAGPHRVTRYAGVPPFRETRDYVARITRAADLELAGSGGAAPTHVADERAVPANAIAIADFAGATPRIARAEPERLIERVDLGRAASPFSTPKQGTVLEWPN